MLEDSVRVQSITEALRQVVPGRNVLEIGGGTGYFACLASKLGAARVSSIDLNPLIRLGPETAIRNGLEHIHFYRGRSQEFEPGERFDVLLHDLRGNTPYFANSLSTLLDARRLLNPDAVVVPGKDIVYAALVDDAEFYAEMEGVWGGCLEGIDLSAFRKAAHRLMRYRASAVSRNWGKQPLVEIDYRTFEGTSLQTDFQLEADFSGTCHGLAIWFETWLTERIGFSNDPWLASERRGATYGVAFLPWPEPVSIVEGARFSIGVSISSQGQYSATIFREQGGFRRALGDFVSERGPGEVSPLPLDGRFQKLPSAKPIRVAVRAIERGRTVRDTLEKIREAGSHRDLQSAAGILSESFRLTQGIVKRNRPYCLFLTFRDCRLEIRTWDRALEEAVRTALLPSWTRLKRTSKRRDVIIVEEVIRSSAVLVAVEFRGQRTLHQDVESAVMGVEAIATEIVLMESETSLVLDCGYQVTESGVSLVFDDDRDRRRRVLKQLGPGLASGTRLTLLSKRGRFLPYGTLGKQPVESPVYEIKRIVFALAPSPPGKGLALTALNSRCLNRKILKDPLSFFHRLLQGVKLDSLMVSDADR